MTLTLIGAHVFDSSVLLARVQLKKMTDNIAVF